MRIGASRHLGGVTQIASISFWRVTPWRSAALVCPLMQYGHCVTSATVARTLEATHQTSATKVSLGLFARLPAGSDSHFPWSTFSATVLVRSIRQYAGKPS